MKVTPRFATAMKFALFIVIALAIYSFILSYFGLSGRSISHPQENTDLRLILNQASRIITTSALWLIIGYMCKDYKAAILALLVSLALHYGIETYFPRTYTSTPTKDLSYYLITFSGMLPILVFGFAHFKSAQAFKLLIYWAIFWGVSYALNSHGFERMIEGFTRIFGVRDPFELRISTGENSYRPISVFRILHSEFFLIVKLATFWWVYQWIKSKISLTSALQTCSFSTAPDRLSYSAIYWGYRLFLFVSGLGIVSFIANSYRFPLDILTILRVVFATVALIIIASIYRNFLVSHFANKEKYPSGLFFLLNIPIVNLFAWIYSLISFKPISNDANTEISEQEKISELQESFKTEKRNNGWKTVIIVMTLFSLLYQLNRAGFRIDGPSRDGAMWLLTTSIVSVGLLLWFLYNKHSYLPLLLIFSANIILAAVVRSESLLQPAMASSIINVVLFYGMFYFDELKWDES